MGITGVITLILQRTAEAAIRNGEESISEQLIETVSRDLLFIGRAA